MYYRVLMGIRLHSFCYPTQHRRQVHTAGLVVRQLQSILEWVQSNERLTHAALIGQNRFLNFLNRPDDCGGLIAGSNSDLRQSRSHRVDLSLPVVRESENFHGLRGNFGLGLTDGCDHGLIEACGLANILA